MITQDTNKPYCSHASFAVFMSTTSPVKTIIQL